MYSDVFCKVYNEFGWNYYPEIFGEQLIVDEDDNVIGKEDTLLINATMIGFEYVHGLTEKYGGLFATPEFSSDNAAGVAILTYLKEKAK